MTITLLNQMLGACHEQDTKDQNSHHFPWNKGKLIAQKLPMKLTDKELIMLFHEHECFFS
jgi:hypothetical protein